MLSYVQRCTHIIAPTPTHRCNEFKYLTDKYIDVRVMYHSLTHTHPHTHTRRFDYLTDKYTDVRVM